MKNKIILLMVFCLSIIVSYQHSYSYHVLNQSSGVSNYLFFNLPSMPVNFRVDGGTLGGGDGLSIVQDACAEWDGLENIGNFCGTLTQTIDINLANIDTIVFNNDFINDIIFDEDGSILNDLVGPGILGIGLAVTDATGTITDITIIINGSIPSSPNADLLATTIHEMGHVWGLAHTPIGGINSAEIPGGLDPIDPVGIPTMYPFNLPVDDSLGRSLETDDFASALLLYGP